MSEHVRTELLEGGGLLRVVFERPGGNVLTGAVMRELDQTLAAHEADPHLKLVTVEGQGKHFSFGASVEEHRRDQAAGMLSTFHALIRRIARYPVATAAVVRGRCLGGAFEVALACRFVFAASGAVFACPEIKLGVVPPVLAALGPSRLGAPWAERLLLTGAELPGSKAEAIGFVTELAPEGTDPWDSARAWFVASLQGLSAWSLRQGVAALALGTGLEVATGDTLDRVEELYLGRLLPSHDGNAGIEAFLAKAQPEWRDA